MTYWLATTRQVSKPTHLIGLVSPSSRSFSITLSTTERPVANESEPLIVSFGLALQQIIDVVSGSFIRSPIFFLFCPYFPLLLVSVSPHYSPISLSFSELFQFRSKKRAKLTGSAAMAFFLCLFTPCFPCSSLF